MRRPNNWHPRVLISGSGSGWLAPAKAAPSRKAANATAHHQRWYQGRPFAVGGRGGGGVPQLAGGGGCWRMVLPPLNTWTLTPEYRLAAATLCALGAGQVDSR
jgi:hypothetical protein